MSSTSNLFMMPLETLRTVPRFTSASYIRRTAGIHRRNVKTAALTAQTATKAAKRRNLIGNVTVLAKDD